MMRRRIVAGNWKMNKNFQEAEDLLYELDELLMNHPLSDAEMVLCPPFLYLELFTDLAKESRFGVGAQNLYPEDQGAFTGEISGTMLASLEVNYCIVGHSERRQYFNEDHDFLARKVKAALRNDLIPIFCCGEKLPEREKGNHQEVVRKQLEESLFFLDPEDFRDTVIAYEPVWAIGTGVNATPEQAQEMHRFIRDQIRLKYGEAQAEEIPILYGGSCNAVNAALLFAQPDVDGGLIGGASLKAADFWSIYQSFPPR